MTTEAGGSLQSLRRTNQERLLSLLLEDGPMHRARLARLAGVSRTTVSTIVTELIGRGLVLEREPPNDRTVDGRARDVLSVNPAAGAAAGLDFTLQDIHCHLTNLSGGPIADAGVSVPPGASRAERVSAGLALLEDLLHTSGHLRCGLIGVGVGVPGQVSPASGVVAASLPGQPWAGTNVAAEFGAHLDVPVFVENNTRLEAVAESMYGAGRDTAQLLYVGLSSGIGTGIFVGGALYRGASGGAGELGHMSVDIDGAACPCGNRGCLVQYAAVPAVLAALRPSLGPDVSLTDVLAATEAGDRACLGVLDDVGRLVGRVLANICNLLNPDRIVVGGELAHAGEVLLEPLRTALHRYAMAATREVEVVAATLELGARAGALGGAALVLRETPGIAAALLATA
ncbi:ROK family transcriptional regulator [Amycolatopsis sp. PS_44_ISF1]|uniref:ROK family transcriptional regulator n=1 Tax=Amycolatopsis sp. PS_44_ISF1 TaxID=2974917 RepID=UPI0028DE6F36|nr:ROK family transcriptional regulator [Amycolatopsis sp. PS_44_ISF1]MDT8913637.1 ROK family protein [Amycolatopsis sp. PS_44_ISF1]